MSFFIKINVVNDTRKIGSRRKHFMLQAAFVIIL